MTDTTPETSAAHQRTVTELVEDATTQLTRLVRDEIQLAGLEMRNKARGFGAGAGLAGVGTLLAFYGGAALVAAAVFGLAIPLPDWAAALIVGAVLLCAGAIFALAGKKSVQRAAPPVPEEALAGMREDIEAIKDGSRR